MHALPFVAVAKAPSTDIELTSLSGSERALDQWLITFPMILVVVDPYTYESSWILDTARRLFLEYRAADCRTAFLSTADVDGTRSFLGPLADEFLAFADPDRAVVAELGLELLPAFVAIRQDTKIVGAAEGWNPQEWDQVTDDFSELLGWNSPPVPVNGDPAAYPGTPALP